MADQHPAPHRLKVIDEVVNGLSYYDYTFLHELPRLYATLEDQLAAIRRGIGTTVELPSFLRMGSWIGGDRDGNPFVTAEVLRQALQLQSKRALSFYLDELHALGGELSLDGRLVGVSDQVRALAERSPDRSTAPARRAVSPRHFGHLRAPRRDRRGARPWRSRCATRSATRLPMPNAARAVRGDLTGHSSLARRERLGDLSRAAGCGAAPRGRRVRLPSRRPRPAAELGRARARRRRALRGSAPGHRLRERLRKQERVGLAARGAADAAPARLAARRLFGRDGFGARRSLRAAAQAHRRYGASRRAELRDLEGERVSDMLEVALLLKEAGLLRPREGELDLNIVPLFETIDDLRNCRRVMDELLSLPDYMRAAREPRATSRR